MLRNRDNNTVAAAAAEAAAILAQASSKQRVRAQHVSRSASASVRSARERDNWCVVCCVAMVDAHENVWFVCVWRGAATKCGGIIAAVVVVCFSCWHCNSIAMSIDKR